MKCMRRHKGEEIPMGASCIALLAIQLGSDIDDLIEELTPIFMSYLTNNSVNFKTRGMVRTSDNLINSFSPGLSQAVQETFKSPKSCKWVKSMQPMLYTNLGIMVCGKLIVSYLN